jgi:HPt (histidine-containing phosphotransfer) domain-containing protein
MKMADAFVLDRASILDRLGGDEEIYVMMIDMYLEDVDSNAAAVGAALAAGDAEALQREAHTVKGLLATFSDDAGAAEAWAIEQQAKLGIVAEQAAAVAALQTRMQEVAGVLKVEQESAAG